MPETNISILDIRLLEWLCIGPFDDTSNIKFNINTTFHTIRNVTGVHINLEYFSKEDDKKTILRCTVSTDFKIVGDKLPRVNGDVDIRKLGDQILVTMISISISHCRALFINQVKSSNIPNNGVPSLPSIGLPLVDPGQILELFKSSFKKGEKSKS